MLPELGYPYRALRNLGKGAQATVWLAEDLRVPGREVAVKLLRDQGAGISSALRREFTLLRRLRHPGLATVFELGSTPANEPFLVAEHVRGESLITWCRGRPRSEALGALAQLLGTLDFLHRREVLHRDVKPDNVLASQQGVRLVDFGLATRTSAAPELCGTPGYMAPEVLAGEQALAASDLYAVGVMLFELLWDRAPFSGSAPEVISRQLSGEAEIPGEPGDVPAALRELAGQLLARDPAQRPASAAEVLLLLQEVEQQGVGRAAEFLAGQGLPEPMLVGRQQVLARLEQALARIRAEDRASGSEPGPVQRVCVMVAAAQRGEGRTRLCEEAATLAALAGVRVLQGFVPGQQLEAIEPDLPAGSAPDPAAQRARAITCFMDQIRTEADRGDGALLVILDDVDDPLQVETVRALSRLGQSEQVRPLGLLVLATTLRGSEADQALGCEGDLEHLALGPLSEPQVADLVRSMLPAGWASGDLAALVHRLSGGNAFLATELTRVAVSRELARGSSCPGRVEAMDLAGAALSEDVAGRMVSLAKLRVQALSPARLRLAALVSLFEAGLPLPLLQEMDPSFSDEDLQALSLQGILQQIFEPAPRLRVAAQSVGQALLEQLPHEERQELSLLGLQALERSGAPARQQAMVALAGGLSASRPDLLLAGAGDARSALDMAASARLYEAALCHLQGPRRREAVRELARVLLVLGRSDQATNLLEQQAGSDPDPDLLCDLADARLRSGDAEAGLQVLKRVGPLPDDEARARIQALRAKLLLFSGKHAEALSASHLVQAQAGPGLAAEARHVAGLAHYYMGRMDEALQELTAAQDLASQKQGEPLLVARITNSAALVHQRRGDLEQARRCYQHCLEQAQAAGHLPFAATFLMNLGSVAQQQGLHLDALEHYNRSLDLAQRFGGARECAQVQHNLGRLYAWLGQQARAGNYLRRSLALARSMGWSVLAAHNLVVQAEVALDLESDEETALAGLQEAEALFARAGESAGQAEVAQVRARWLLQKGHAEEALDQAERVGQLGQGMEHLQLQALLLAGRAELARPGGDFAQARQKLEAALSLAEKRNEQEPLVEIHHFLSRACSACQDPLAETLHREASLRLLGEELSRLPAPLHQAYSQRGLRARVLQHPEADRKGARAAGAARAPGAAGAPKTAGAFASSVLSQVRVQSRHAALDAELLAALLEISKELNAETDLRRLLERIIDHAVDLTGAERGFLILAHPAGAGERPVHIEVARNIDQETIRRKEFKISRSVAEQVLDTGRPLLTVNAMEDTRFEEFLSVHNLRLRSILCVPLTIRRELRGAIYLDNRFQVQTFTEKHQELLSALADQAALAIGNRELMEDNRLRQEELGRSEKELSRLNEQLRQAMERQSLQLDELTRLAQSQQGELEGRYQFENLVGQSAAMRELFRLMDRIKEAEAPVLIHGESGTGKELVAKALHYNSRRKEAPFVSVNCGALAPTLLESELFGYEKGAFTGADRLHRGLFERSHGGSLFLDEVGDMPPELQVKLLRVLQEKRFARIGGEKELGSDFRLLAASNKDLQQLVHEGTFREDLFYRINVIQLRLPPLRERREDIPLLVEHLLCRHDHGRPQAEKVQVSRAALNLLVDHEWPGNVRELENEILRALALGGPLIQPEELSPRLQGPVRVPGMAREQGLDPGPLTLKEAMRRLELQLVSETLRACGGSVTEAARRLGLSRVGLHKLMSRLGLQRREVP